MGGDTHTEHAPGVPRMCLARTLLDTRFHDGSPADLKHVPEGYRMKHKKLIVIVAVVAVMGIAATAAYAWFVASASVNDNHVATATAGNFNLYGGPVSATGLIPAKDPSPGEVTGTPTKYPDTVYPASTYFALDNAASYSMLFFGYLSTPTGNLDPSLVGIRIYLNPPASAPGYPGGWGLGTFNTTSPTGWVVFQGHLSDIVGESNGRWYLSSSSGPNFTDVLTPINPGERAIYRLGLWLDGNVANNTNASSRYLDCDFTFSGEQVH
jgi:hypothetical protein